MKRIVNIVVFALALGSSYAQQQDLFSVYFRAAGFKELALVSQVADGYFKRYKLSDTEKNEVRNAAGEYLVVDESGIYIEKNKLLFVTREQVREDPKYQVRNGYLFGVVKNDSIPTALEGENYYFLLPSKTYLAEKGSASTKIYNGLNSGEYLLATAEPDGYYSCIYLRFKAGKLDVMELPLDTDSCSIGLVRDQQLIPGEIKTYILAPTLKEWQALFGCFSVYDDYVVAA